MDRLPSLHLPQNIIFSLWYLASTVFLLALTLHSYYSQPSMSTQSGYPSYLPNTCMLFLLTTQDSNTLLPFSIYFILLTTIKTFFFLPRIFISPYSNSARLFISIQLLLSKSWKKYGYNILDSSYNSSDLPFSLSSLSISGKRGYPFNYGHS